MVFSFNALTASFVLAAAVLYIFSYIIDFFVTEAVVNRLLKLILIIVVVLIAFGLGLFIKVS